MSVNYLIIENKLVYTPIKQTLVFKLYGKQYKGTFNNGQKE